MNLTLGNVESMYINTTHYKSRRYVFIFQWNERSYYVNTISNNFYKKNVN